MRDLAPWSYPLFRWFGIPIKVHITLIIFGLGSLIRILIDPATSDRIFEGFLLIGPLYLGLLLLHEWGHWLSCRLVDLEYEEFNLWPLGGLHFPRLVDSPRAQTFAALGGLMVHVIVGLVCFVVLAGAGFFPNLNPFADPFAAELKNYRDQRIYTSEFSIRLYEPGTAESAPLPKTNAPSGNASGSSSSSGSGNSSEASLTPPRGPLSAELIEAVQKSGKDRAVAPLFFVWIQRLFWLNWILFLLNLLPAWPLDGGQLLYGLLWSRSDEEQATTTTAWFGYAVAVILLIASLAANEVWPMGLAIFIGMMSWLRLNRHLLQEAMGGNDYDYGYSLRDDDDLATAPKPRKQSFLKRWLAARHARRIQRDLETKLKEDERVDQLLDKITEGKTYRRRTSLHEARQ